MVLDSLRQKQNSLLVYFIFGLIIISFIMWGGMGNQGEPDKEMIRVGDVSVTESEFSYRFDNQRRRLGNTQLDAQFVDYIKKITLNSLIREKVLYQAAQSLGLPFGDQEISDYVTNLDAFQNAETGRFERKRYIDYIDQIQLTPQQFEHNLRVELMNAKISSLLKLPVLVTAQEAINSYRIKNTKINLDYVEIDPSRDLKQMRIPEERMQVYYDAHRDEFQTDESRRVRVLKLFADDLKNRVELSDADVQAAYTQTVEEAPAEEQKQFEEPRAWARHILVEVRDTKDNTIRARARSKARAILEEVKANPTAFESIARDKSDDPSAVQNGGDLGYFAYSAMVKPFSKAVFEAKEGQIIGPVETPFGFHVIQVMDVHPEEGLSLTKFRREIEEKLRTQRAATLHMQLVQQIEKQLEVGSQQDESAGYELFDLIARTHSLPVVTPEPIKKTGVIESLPDSFIVVEEAFKLKTSNPLSGLIRQNKRAYLVYLEGIVDPQPLPYAEAKPLITKKLRNVIVEERLKKTLKDAIQFKRDLKWVAGKFNTEVKETGLFTKFGSERIPKIGASNEVALAAAKASAEPPFLPDVYRVQSKLYIFHVKALEEAKISEFLKDPLKHVDKVRQDKELQITVRMNEIFERRANIPKDFFTKQAQL